MKRKRAEHREKQRLLSIPMESVAADMAAMERTAGGLWCVVARELLLVLANGERTDFTIDWSPEYGPFIQWVRVRPERNHDTHESAVAFVRSELRKDEVSGIS